MKKGLPREETVQEAITKKLEKLELLPFSVICTFCGDLGGTVSITFYIEDDLNSFLDFLDYPSRCDKTGYTIYQKYNTVILSGIALIDLYIKV